MKVVLTNEQLSFILKNKSIVLDGKLCKFNAKAMTKLRKLIKQRAVTKYDGKILKDG